MRIVIKVGSSTITHQTGKINYKFMDMFARVISDISNEGNEVILVSSGAQAVGTSKLGFEQKPVHMAGKQAVAAVGQSELMSIYSKVFGEYSYQVGQILLTKDVIEVTERKENVINTFNALIEYGCIPIVNENDSVEVEEIKFGENDSLSAIVAVCVKADLLILLSDVDALYNGDPRTNSDAKPIKKIEKIDEKIRSYAGNAGSDKGTGGMITKINAAEIAMNAGIDMIIALGDDPKILYDIMDKKEVGTLFTVRKP